MFSQNLTTRRDAGKMEGGRRVGEGEEEKERAREDGGKEGEGRGR